MELYNRIIKLRPGVDPNDFRLRDNSDGNGPFIEEWLSSETQPDDDEIASVDDSIPTALAVEAVQNNRRAAYQAEADHLHLEEERGEVEAGTWVAKVSEIKARYPKA